VDEITGDDKTGSQAFEEMSTRAKRTKTVLIISPQPWGTMFVSKHHYALELERSGYDVYFLDPPVKGRYEKVKISKPFQEKNLFVIRSSFPNILFFRYHIPFIYAQLVKYWLKRVIKAIPPADIVWCFDTNTIKDLAVFKGSKKIFHIVDPINDAMINTANTADLSLCVSDRILGQLKGTAAKRKFINHALSDGLIEKAKKIDLHHYRAGSIINVGYVGNLSRSIIDKEMIGLVVKANPDICFHFWGPGKESNLGGEDNGLSERLQHLPNVKFHKPAPSEKLIGEISNMDAFILAYKNIPGVYDCSNSHKILEYFATGKVLISTYIDQYSSEAFHDYLQMTPENENEKFPELFRRVISDLAIWNDIDKMQQRRAFAFENSYSSNTKKILETLGER
jgi:glycosyltransferase involved in cell wall biosynthesis